VGKKFKFEFFVAGVYGLQQKEEDTKTSARMR
jgi:hypothetical protein